MIRTKLSAAIFSALILFAIMYPIKENWQASPKDNFPLSYYPMFSHKRDSTYSVNYFVGYDAQDNRILVPYKFAGSGGFNQVRRQINRKCKEGEAKALTKKVAKRLAKSEEVPYNTLVRVELVKGTYHLDNYFIKGDKNPIKEKVLSKRKITRP